MKLNCLSCGLTVHLSDAYEDYDGLVKCFACGAMLHVRTADGNLKRMEVVPSARAVVNEPPGQNPDGQIPG